MAIGDRNGDVSLHIAANSVSSSFLPMLPTHLASAPGSAYVDDVVVAMTTLDRAIDRHLRPGERLFVKVDAQGMRTGS